MYHVEIKDGVFRVSVNTTAMKKAMVKTLYKGTSASDAEKIIYQAHNDNMEKEYAAFRAALQKIRGERKWKFIFGK